MTMCWHGTTSLCAALEVKTGRVVGDVHRSTRELEEAIRHYIETTNTQSKPFVWTKTADEIIASVGRFCKFIADSGHVRELRGMKITPHVAQNTIPIEHARAVTLNTRGVAP
jgi:hypothetical protein